MESTVFPRNIGSARVEITLINGKNLDATAFHAHGMPNEPCTEDEIREKFRRLAGAAITEQAVAEITTLVGHMETLPSVAPLTEALRAGICV
jgi:2-methylcitrate dehydratase PrpD